MQQFFRRLSKAFHFYFFSSASEITETEVSDFFLLFSSFSCGSKMIHRFMAFLRGELSLGIQQLSLGR